uniref:Antiluteolysin n=1 Tax=Capra hircus TaxID=9925 RepID=A0A8C2XYB9_CAPHI
HYPGDLSENAIFCFPTQDSGNQAFSTKGLTICAPLNQYAKDPLSVAPKGQSHFRFPRKREMITKVQMIQGPCNHYLMLQQSFQLFTTEDSRATWNNSLLDKLLSSPDQRCLVQIIRTVMGEEDSALGRTGPILTMKKYFQGIHFYLQEKEYSDCAWEIVRVEMMRALSSSTTLQERLKKMGGDLNSP